MIKKENKRITITLTKDDLLYLDHINNVINKKTYSQAIKSIIKLFKSLQFPHH